MQKTDKSTSTPSSSSSISGTSTRPRGVRLLIAALSGLLAGLVACMVAVALMGILRLVFGIPSPVELFGDFALKHMSAGQFVHLLIVFAPNSKTAPLGLALLGMIGAGTVLGLVYALATRIQPPVADNRPTRREWLTAALLDALMVLTGGILFWNELGQNFLGLPIEWARAVTILALLGDFSLYALALCLSYRALLPKLPASAKNGSSGRLQGMAPTGRRQLLARASVAVLGIGGAAGSLGAVKAFLNSYSSYDGMETFPHNGFTAPITPNSEHYVVTQNAIDPAVALDLWRLEITGLVGQSGAYTYNELTSLPSTSRAITLECISNNISVASRLMSTAVWQGVPLKTLLDRHGGAQPGARYIAFYAVDGYSTSLPLDEVLAVDPLVAWRMNGVELPMRHGFPARVLIPGRYGEENPKWLTRIELTDSFVGGIYADQGWYNGEIYTMSRIDRPTGHVPLGQPVNVGGIAFAGPRGIQKVEVSTDKGLTWHTSILQPPLSPDAWVFWSWQWTPMLPGTYTLLSRATDGTGAAQTGQLRGAVPHASTGYYHLTVQVG
ncbi:MAG TPA: molybdopterin-dependent oxidoreductase [Ktedonobacteraceae bacterium]|nr:molybdopterin-dependent oxidoreductase [Ktedonobacteraceae bacterium]